MAWLAVVASVSMVPVRSAPGMAVTLLDSAAIAVPFGLRRGSLGLRWPTPSCIGELAGLGVDGDKVGEGGEVVGAQAEPAVLYRCFCRLAVDVDEVVAHHV